MTRKALSLSYLIDALLPVVQKAGDIIMEYYQKDSGVEHKQDSSPVTAADRAADAYIVEWLKKLAPEIAIVSEEGAQPDVAHEAYFWLVDPLDGTRSFVRGSGYFTVNIGLIGPERVPLAGIIYDPVHKAMYWGYEDKAYRCVNGGGPESLRMRLPDKNNVTAIVSHSRLNEETTAYLGERHVIHRYSCASSIKFCRLAEGEADIYPRFGPTMEWDTAAGHAIVLAAGGTITTPEGEPFLYGKSGFLNCNFVAQSLPS